METPSRNDTYNDLLWKLASNLYEKAVADGKSGMVLPQRGGSDVYLLKAAVTNSASLLS